MEGIEDSPQNENKVFCNRDCQIFLLESGLVAAIGIGIFSFLFLIYTLFKQIIKLVRPAVQEKLICTPSDQIE